MPRIAATTSWGACCLLSLALPISAQTQAPPVPPVPQTTPPTTAPPPTAPTPPAPKNLYDQTWTTPVELTAPLTLAVAAHVAVGASASRVVAWNLDDGHERWHHDFKDISALAANGNGILIGGHDVVREVDTDSGEDRWASPPLGPIDRLTTRGGWVVTSAGADLAALRDSDGSVVWHLTLGAAIVGAPQIDGDALFVLLADGRLARLRLTTGDMEWAVGLDAAATDLLAANDRVYVSLSDGRLLAYDQRDGRFEWRYQFSAQAIDAAVSDTSHVYVSLMDNSVQALDRNVGNQRWKATLSERPVGAPQLTGGAVLLPAAGGEIGIVQAKDGKSVGHLAAPVAPAGTPGGAPRLLALGVASNDVILRLVDNGDGTLALAAFRRAPPPAKK